MMQQLREKVFITLKGGIPATPSGTTTLLRLSSSYRSNLNQLFLQPLSSGPINFRSLTGGVYKVRERIHRAIADARLLAIPTS
jgi:hypothetical protein